MSTIFVSIASYRDSELIPTLKDLVKNSASPEKLHIAVCWQHNETVDIFQQAGMKLTGESTLDDFILKEYEFDKVRINIISVEHYRSKGACWARNMAEKLYTNEDYFLQIDSHCRFINQWDNEMIIMLKSLKTQSAKPVLSHYPAGYKPDNEEERFKYNNVSRIAFLKFNDHGIPVTFPTAYSSDKPLKSSYFAGGFVFAEGSFVKEVPNDPDIFFVGEEIMMAARAFTHGYDIYSPHKILLWHYYVRKNVKYWDDHDKKAKENGKIDMVWWDRNRISNKRLRNFFDLQSDHDCRLGIYAPGKIRTLREFEYTSGISFKNRAVQPEVVGKDRVNWFQVDLLDKENWEIKLISPYHKKLIIELEKFNFSPEQVQHWHLTVLDTYNHLIDEIKLTAEEIKKKFESAKEGKIEFELKFNTYPHFTPTTVRMIPYFSDSSWGEAVEVKW
ncbi:GlcNAc-transferase family protein [Pantoea sp.]|uniref:GlcNAc-transferase family protein n=1 Tax=Pantoea sp. TaxID=69393 RepID=UPI00289982A2|nr:GlcNAc-transferase family protein [Pantoea sp.]